MKPRILAHRGASGHAPENSLAAFRMAAELGADGVELDIHTTMDGTIVVHHDPVLPDGRAIGSSSWSEIHSAPLPSGQSLPTLEEALAALEGLEVWVEVKGLPPRADSTLLDLLAGSGTAERYGVHSFDHRIVARLGGLEPGLRRGILSASYPLDSIAPVRAAGASVLWQERHLIDGDLVRQAHAAGIEIIAWTVNDAHDAERLSALGVDALCGNYPERLRVR